MAWTEAQYDQFLKARGQSSKDQKEQKVVLAGAYSSNWSGRVTVGGQECYFRSAWEYNYACYLEWIRTKGLIASWEHEPQKFNFRDKYKSGEGSYWPDFKVNNLNGTYEWHEVKGWLNPKSKQKIVRFHKQFPDEPQTIIISGDWFKRNYNTQRLIPGWLSVNELKLKYPKGSKT